MTEPRNKRRPEGSRTYLVVLLIVAGVLLLSFASGYRNAVRLGLDLQGGLELVLKATPDGDEQLTSEQLTKAVEVIRSRVDSAGTTEPEIRTQGSDQVVVSLPGEQNVDAVERIVSQRAQLRFYEWEKNVVDDKVFRSAHEALRANDESAKASVTKAEKDGGKVTRQLYAFDPQDNLIAGPASSQKRLVEQTIDAVRGTPEADRPDGWETIEEEGALPKDWSSFEVPVGNILVHGPPEQLVGGDIALQEGGKFDSNAGAWALIKDDPGLSGDHIKSATAGAGQGGWVTSIIFDRTGGRTFGKVTEQIAKDGARKGTPQRFAIILDDVVQSVPQIDYKQYPTGIKGGQAQISGLDDRQEADDLSNVLNNGALPVRFEVVSKTQVSATLGSKSLEDGLRAGAIGLLAVMIYLILVYRMLGLIADLALGAFALIFYGIVVALPVTMTLPGIAGAILTIGVAADANIIIFERIREEYRAGRSVVQSITAGYKKGFATILDASAVTLITAALLIVISIGTVRGFAVLLGIGTLLSMFTAVAFTYALLGVLSHIPFFQKPWVIGGSRKHQGPRFHLPFMKYRNFFIGLTCAVLLAAFATVAIRGLNLGVDFRSGTRFDVQFQKDTNVGAVGAALLKVDPDYEATVQETRDTVGGKQSGSSFAVTVDKLLGGTRGSEGTAAERTREQQSSAQERVRQEFDDQFTLKDGGFNVETIGPSFGKQVLQLAIVAVIASLILEVLYIWWRFELLYAVPVLLSLIHDMALAAGAYAITGREFNSTTVAALLTILGYSLYDTIIVFDRVRENAHILRKSSFSRIINTSLNEVLARSINTSIVVLIPVSFLMIFGGDTLQDFAFALLIGVAAGVVSSITVASPVLSLLKEREPAWQKRLQAEQAADAAGGTVIPTTGETPSKA
ncbi:MAG: secD [Thermoleophilia bacterium]|nr:secD [Thermoleophilia bacterium]